MGIRTMVLAAALLLAALAPERSRAADVVRIGITNASSDITFFLADRKGYFREEGIEVKLIAFDSGAKMVAPLGAGQLDVGGGAASAGLYNALQRGIDMKIVADKATNTAQYSYKALLVRKALVASGAFKTLADLKGRSIAIVANGAADNSVLNEALKSVGLTLGDVRRVYLGFPQQPVALENGGVDAAISAEPEVTRAVRLGSSVRFEGISAFYPVQETAVVLYGGDFVKRRVVATKFMKAYLRAVRDYDRALKDGRIAGPGAEEVVRIMAEVTHAPDARLFREMVPSWCDPDGRVDVESLKKDLDFFKSQGEVKGAVTVEEVMDGSFVAAALAALGPSRPESR